MSDKMSKKHRAFCSLYLPNTELLGSGIDGYMERQIDTETEIIETDRETSKERGEMLGDAESHRIV